MKMATSARGEKMGWMKSKKRAKIDWGRRKGKENLLGTEGKKKRGGDKAQTGYL